MSKAKVIKKKIPIGAQDADLAELFNQMVGAGLANLTIAYPRYMRIKEICQKLVKIFEYIRDSAFISKRPSYKTQYNDLVAFCKTAKDDIQKLFSVDLSSYEWNLSLVSEELRKIFTEVYEAVKKSNIVNMFVVMCDRLTPYKQNFIDENALDPTFITSMPGVVWYPFPFIESINMKDIFVIPNIDKTTQTFFMTVLHKAYKLSRQLWDELQSPDVDVDQFITVIMSNIEEIQKRPELSRCKDAFAKIKSSVMLLKGKFNGYYRNFMETKDSTIIMQNFIIDVSKSTQADAKTAFQFQQIISYYRKIASDQIKNPKVKMLFDKVNDSLKIIGRGTENLSAETEHTKDSDNESGEESQETVVTLLGNPTAMSLNDLDNALNNEKSLNLDNALNNEKSLNPDNVPNKAPDSVSTTEHKTINNIFEIKTPDLDDKPQMNPKKKLQKK